MLKSTGPGPTPAQRVLLLSAVSAGLALAAAALALRASASYFDRPREDNVVTLVMLGLVVCISGLVPAAGLPGWPWVAGLPGVAVTYSGAAAIFAGNRSGIPRKESDTGEPVPGVGLLCQGWQPWDLAGAGLPLSIDGNNAHNDCEDNQANSNPAQHQHVHDRSIPSSRAGFAPGR